jgi:hypothetical protein
VLQVAYQVDEAAEDGAMVWKQCPAIRKQSFLSWLLLGGRVRTKIMILYFCYNTIPPPLTSSTGALWPACDGIEGVRRTDLLK